jgi:hypothetical protein
VKLFLAILITFSSSFSFACDFGKDIKENADGTYTYTRSCHIEAGKAFRSVKLLGEKIDLLEKEIELKDLQIKNYDERNRLWMATSFEIYDKMQSYEANRSRDNWLHFGLGMGLSILSVYAASQAVR